MSPNSWIPTVVVRPQPGESAIGLLIRHCEANGWPRLHDFANQIGTNASRMRWTPDLPVLERVLGRPPGELSTMDRGRDGAAATLCGHRFPLRMVDKQTRRICPDCAAEDGYMREWWELSFLHTCDRHGRELTGLCPCGRPLAWDDAIVGRCGRCAPETGAQVEAGGSAEPSRFERWVLGRIGILDAPCPNGTLETTSVPQVVDAVEAIGLFVAGGYRKDRPIAADFGLSPRDVRLLGFDAIAEGNLTVHIAASIREYCRVTGIALPDEPRWALGWFGDWIDGIAAFIDTPFLKPVLDGLSLEFGFPITNMRSTGMVCVERLAREVQVSVETVRQMANDAGFTVQVHAGRRMLPRAFVPTLYQTRHESRRKRRAGLGK